VSFARRARPRRGDCAARKIKWPLPGPVAVSPRNGDGPEPIANPNVAIDRGRPQTVRLDAGRRNLCGRRSQSVSLGQQSLTLGRPFREAAAGRAGRVPWKHSGLNGGSNSCPLLWAAGARGRPAGCSNLIRVVLGRFTSIQRPSGRAQDRRSGGGRRQGTGRRRGPRRNVVPSRTSSEAPPGDPRRPRPQNHEAGRRFKADCMWAKSSPNQHAKNGLRCRNWTLESNSAHRRSSGSRSATQTRPNGRYSRPAGPAPVPERCDLSVESITSGQ